MPSTNLAAPGDDLGEGLEGLEGMEVLLEFLSGHDPFNGKREEAHVALMDSTTNPRVDDNPLLHEFWEPWAREVGYAGEGDNLRALRHSASASMLLLRDLAVRAFSWAVPSEEALAAIIQASKGRILEIGSGTGYWANLLQTRGADIVAVDNGSKNHALGARWFPATLIEDGEAYLRRTGGSADRTLFLCLPRNGPTDAIAAAYAGDTIVLVGEANDGCTWWLYDQAWEWVRKVVIPTWAGLHDIMVVFRRVAKPA